VKTIKELLQPSEIIESSVSLDTKIVDVVQDSRCVSQGSLFVALKGGHSDGHLYLSEVSRKGAISVVESSTEPRADLWVKVRSTREILGKIASRFWGNPTTNFNLVGVTGTNGKTTTCFLLDQLWTEMGLVTGMIGTVKNKIGREILDSNLTTPGPIELQELFHRMAQRRVEACAIEVSSIALDQYRTQGSDFKVAVFTNFSQDHLDYHQTMESYLEAKLKLFSDYHVPCVVVNLDDPQSEKVLKTSDAKRKLTFSLANPNADFSVVHSEFRKNGIMARIKTPQGEFEFVSPLIGEHNLMNILAVLAVVEGLNQDLSLSVKALSKSFGAPGRLQRAVVGDYYPSVFVDYAHSDDALENVLKALHKLRGDAAGKIITVFGCGGDRDKTKRPKMAKVASRFSDITVATSDNPRTEDPDSILNDIEVGIERDKTSYHREINRRAAICLALKLAKQEDIVLIAGKGHETYQIIGTQKQDFDDIRVVRDFYGL